MYYRRLSCIITTALLILLEILIVISMLSCSGNGDDPGFEFPLKEGNRWEYYRDLTGMYITYGLEGEPNDTTWSTNTSTLTLEIQNKEAISDAIEAFRFFAEEIENETIYSNNYFINSQNDGMYIYAYDTSGSTTFPLNINTSSKCYHFHDIGFASLEELSDFFHGILGFSVSDGDSLFFEEPPLKVLEYPLDLNSSWTYRIEGNPFGIDKLVVDSLKVEVPAGLFSSYKVELNYELPDIVSYQYFCDTGLVKFESEVIGVSWIDYEGDLIGEINVYETIEMTEFDLK